MADKKISALTASTTPLAGTEVLPIVQSGATVKVSVANLTAGRAVNALSVATTSGAKNTTAGSDIASPTDGYLFTDGANKNAIIQLGASGQLSTFVFEAGGAGWRRVAALLPNGNSVVDVGNLVIGTSGKGIDFSATPGTGTSELFSDYEEGTWTPTINSATGVCTLSSSAGFYTKIGRMVYVNWRVTFSTDASVGTSTLTIGGLPFTSAAPSNATLSLSTWSGGDYGTGGANGSPLIGVSTTITHEARTINISSRTAFAWYYSGSYQAA
jgi:hypothetical protein